MKLIDYTLLSNRAGLPGVVLAATLLASLPSQLMADTRTWSGAKSKEFTNTANYDPAGGLNGNELIFDKPGLDLIMDAASATPAIIRIRNAASGFRLVSSADRELLLTERLVVDANTQATLDVKFGLDKTTAGSSLILDVGTGGRLDLLKALALFSENGTVTKSGGGTLYIATSSGSAKPGVSLRFEEGTTILKGGSTLGTPTQGAAGQINAYIGTATQSATFMTEYVSVSAAARFHGTLTTAGASRSRLEINGELKATTLDISEGATIKFNLQGMNSFISGTSISFGEEVNIELSGAVVGNSYNLFRFTDVEGFDPALFNVTGIGSAEALWSVGSGGVSVQVVMIPEAHTLFLSLAGMVVIGAWRRGRRCDCGSLA